MSQALVALFFLFLFSLLILFYLEHETAMRQAGPNEKKKKKNNSPRDVIVDL